MRYNLIIIIVLAVFLFGCVHEGIRVVRVTNNTQPSGNVPAVAPSTTTPQNTTVSNQTTATNQTNTTTTTNTPSPTVPTGKATNADLAINSFYMSSLNPRPNEEFSSNFKIKNLGTEAIANFEYTIKIMKGNDVKKSETFIFNDSIAAGSSTEKIVKTFSLELGEYEFMLTLDSAYAYAEKDESNNLKKQKFAVINPISSNGTTVYNSSSSSSSSSNSSTSSNTGCTDTDGGAVYSSKGFCSDKFGQSVMDMCLEVNKLWEWKCVSGRCVYEEKTCTCVEGKCV